ncbi:MAG: CHAP domain-containing protein [Lachnospiraceae bacterium]|nr:CHAP domain-containing protein [Lachnospiraceae bacterium]
MNIKNVTRAFTGNISRIFLSGALSILLTAACGTSVSATSRTADEAISWVNSKLGQYLDMDGAYGAQCVDLILAYYDYLGVSRSSGNGRDYAWNALPSGWSRVQGGNPQKGDILVYGASSGNPYGHVAIYESDYSTYHQNFDSSPVKRVTYYYKGLSNPYWGYIRPNWSSPVPVTPNWENKTGSITETNALLSTTVYMPNQGNFTLCAITLWNSSGNVIAQKTENVNYNTSYMNVWYDINGELGVRLSPGQTYKYQFTAVYNGTTYKSGVWTFNTAGTAPTPQPTPQPSPQPSSNVKLSAARITYASSPQKRKAVVKWSKVSNSDGYQILISYKKNFSTTVASGYVLNPIFSSTVTCNITGLQSNRTCYFKVRPYKTVSGKKVYGAYSAVRSLKIK